MADLIACGSCNHSNLTTAAFCTCCGIRLVNSFVVTGPRLVMLYGENREVIFPLAADCTRIGRDLDNDIILNDQMISKRHAEIFAADSKFWIRDLDSRNGVFVNGGMIKEDCRLSDGSLIKIGFTLVRFESGSIGYSVDYRRAPAKADTTDKPE